MSLALVLVSLAVLLLLGLAGAAWVRAGSGEQQRLFLHLCFSLRQLALHLIDQPPVRRRDDASDLNARKHLPHILSA